MDLGSRIARGQRPSPAKLHAQSANSEARFTHAQPVTAGLAASCALVVPKVASMTTAAIDSRTIPLFIAAVRVLLEQRDCISAALLSRDTTSENKSQAAVDGQMSAAPQTTDVTTTNKFLGAGATS